MIPAMVITFLKELLLPGLLTAAWVAYLFFGARWLKGVKRVRLF